VKQGLIKAFGVLTDTLTICTNTPPIMLFSDAYHQPSLSAIALPQASLTYHVGAWASRFLAVLMLRFGFSPLMVNY
ncbi:UNVERIFIED_CONTAM: alanine:cation symporter family protein, partial [Bacillus amyloliquefaciens DSM 7 = ATCC 23350]